MPSAEAAAKLTPEVKAVIKATAPVLAGVGTEITQAFYPLLFRAYPQVKQLFNKRNQTPAGPRGEDDEGYSAAGATPPRPSVGAQPRALANAVYAYAANIENLGALTGAISLIAHKHASLHVLPEHYPMVGDCLLRAIKLVLKEAATDEIMHAWEVAYGFLAEVLIEAEDALRADNQRKRHGWAGWQEMTVLRKVKESGDTTSFYLGHADGTPVCRYLPGQYISLRVSVPTEDAPEGEWQERDYSISEYAMQDAATAPTGNGASGKPATPERGLKEEVKTSGSVSEEGATRTTATDTTTDDINNSEPPHFRITVKRIPGGLVSTHLHDVVEAGDALLVGPPYGDFTVCPRALAVPVACEGLSARPIVLLSAGIGLTPILTMTQALLSHKSAACLSGRRGPQQIFLLHTVRDGAHHPLAPTLNELAAAHTPPRFSLHVNFTRPRAGLDAEGEDYQAKGRLTLAHLQGVLGKVRPSDCHFFFCGPVSFMSDVRGLLAWLNVPAAQIQYEVFGPLAAEVDAAGLLPTY